MSNEDCGVCWGSHGCHLQKRHEGDHACIDEDDVEAHSTVGRDGRDASGFQWDLYQVDLLRYDGDFCELCGSIERAPHINAVLDHARDAHPGRWLDDGLAAEYADYVGNGVWRSREAAT